MKNKSVTLAEARAFLSETNPEFNRAIPDSEAIYYCQNVSAFSWWKLKKTLPRFYNSIIETFGGVR